VGSLCFCVTYDREYVPALIAIVYSLPDVNLPKETLVMLASASEAIEVLQHMNIP
jgi:hypothetical protein